MTATGISGSESRDHRRPFHPEDAASWIVSAMELLTPQEAYDTCISHHQGVEREFWKIVRSMLLAQGIGIEA